MAGFEPTTFAPPERRATKLRHIPLLIVSPICHAFCFRPWRSVKPFNPWISLPAVTTRLACSGLAVRPGKSPRLSGCRLVFPRKSIRLSESSVLKNQIKIPTARYSPATQSKRSLPLSRPSLPFAVETYMHKLDLAHLELCALERESMSMPFAISNLW